MAGSHNDINMLECSPVFVRVAKSQAPECNYEISVHQYEKGYYQQMASILIGRHLWKQSTTVLVRQNIALRKYMSV